jgi:hypothetical protein
MLKELDADPSADVNVMALDLQNALKETEALLAPADDMAKRTLLPLLKAPLNVAGKLGDT